MGRTSKFRALAVVIALILTIMAAACARPSQTPVPSVTVTPVPTDKVAVKNSSFDPPAVIVGVGTAVTWTNQDQASYSVADNAQTFAFNLPAEGSFSITFTEAGTYYYHCSTHPYIQGMVMVAPSSYTGVQPKGPIAEAKLIRLPVQLNRSGSH